MFRASIAAAAAAAVLSTSAAVQSVSSVIAAASRAMGVACDGNDAATHRPLRSGPAGGRTFIWTTPWGFLKTVATNNATVRQGAGLQVVSFSPANFRSHSGLPYTVTGYINPQNLVQARRDTVAAERFFCQPIGEMEGPLAEIGTDELAGHPAVK